MTRKAEALLDAVLELPPEERAEFAAILADSVAGEAPESVAAEWIAEARRRLAAVRAGQVEPVPWEEVERRLRTHRRS